MKYIYCCLFLFALSYVSIAQNATKQVQGSFSVKGKIIGYHYRFAESNNTYAFRLYNQLNVSLKTIDVHKIDSTQIKLDSAYKLISSVEKIPDSVRTKIKNLLSTSSGIIDLYKKDHLLKEDKSKIAKKFADSLGIYFKDSLAASITDSLLKTIDIPAYGFEDLADISNDWKDATQGKDIEEFYYLNDWDLNLFKNLFVAALNKTSIKGDSTVKRNAEIDDLASSVFFEIKTRSQLINDNSIAAYMHLQETRIELMIGIDEFLETGPETKREERDERRIRELETKEKKEEKKLENFKKKKEIKDRIRKAREERRKIAQGESNKMAQSFAGAQLSMLSAFELRKIINSYKPSDSVAITFVVKEITVEFEDGTIKNIFADMVPYYKYQRLGPDNFSVRFRNSTPISMSGKFDPEKFVNHSIFAGDPRELYKHLIRYLRSIGGGWKWNEKEVQKLLSKDEKNTYKSRDFSISLSDLIRYDPVSEVDNEDYSPQNSVVKISPQSPVATLYKEYRSKIITVKAFSDFIGVRDDQPNGLIQFEASRKMNIWTKRKRFIGMPLGETSYFWILTYIEPRLTISKIENNNKALLLDTNHVDMSTATTTGKANFKLNALEIRQYQNFNFSTYLNIFKLSFHNVKSSFHGNMHGGYSRTLISDSVQFIKDTRPAIGQSIRERNLNTLMWGFDVIYEIKPDSRYGFQFGYEWNKIVPRSSIYSLEPNKSVVQAFWSEGFLKTGDDAKLFFRFRYNNLLAVPSTNFMQVQLGYLLDLFKSAKKPVGTVQTAN